MRARQGSKPPRPRSPPRCRAACRCYPITDGAIDARVILGLGAAAENDLAARPSHHDGEEDHEHDDFASVVIDLPEVTDIDALVASVQRLAREQNVLRVKGYIAVAGKPMRLLLQAVGERVRHQFDKPWGAASRQSKLVVIGEHGDIDEAAIKVGLGFRIWYLMHVVFRESRGLEETATPRDIGQDPADLVVLSYSDFDLAAFAAGWRRGRNSLPSLRLANLAELRHPLSVDTYIERTLSQARGILVRLIGGESYWPYGLAALQQLAKDRNIVLAVLPADGRDDTRLDAYSTLPVSTLRRLKVLCDTGGPVAAQAAIAQLALASGLYAGPVVGEMNRARDGLLRSRAWRHCCADGRRGKAARARDLLSFLSHRRGYRAGRRPDRGAARAAALTRTACSSPR